ncbi:MAG: hypothetical protein K9N51_04290 [Candidatus Pacebacteria bacterium]|nr:hypothetical protein [Candidatus Paceibacterota bacterium]
MIKYVTGAFILALSTCAARAVPVGTYLYANDAYLEQYKGTLTVTFASPGDRLVIAYGYKNRKLRQSRHGTTETDRERFKPVQAHMTDNGKKAHFPHLAPDFYDIIVINENDMTLHEGLHLYQSATNETGRSADLLAEVKKGLKGPERLVSGWESFFDTKEFLRFESDGTRGCFLIQQMRLAKAYEESGAEIKGCIHSIDMCWLERAKVEGVGWQVITRQQLYRAEIQPRKLFEHAYVPALNRIRVGVRQVHIGPVELPHPHNE